MINKLNKQRTIAIVIIILSFLLSAYLYPIVPDRIPVHWNENGEVDAYDSKEVGLFLMPILSVVIYIILVYLPYLDPLKENVDKFREYYEWSVILFLLFFSAIHLLGILWALGYEIKIQHILFPGIAILFYALGELMNKAKRNWFIGIRTPWTMSSEKVWDSTHKIGAKLFKLYSLFVLLMLVLGIMSIWVVIGPLILITIWSCIYSYLEYKKLRR